MIQAILFDVDGVLVHPWRWRSILTDKHGIVPEMTASFFKGIFIECANGRADLAEVLPPFLASWGWTSTTADFMAQWFVAENAPNEPLLELVATLRRRGMRCFVASTQERHRAEYLRTAMGFDRRFDGLFFSSEVGVAKPSRGFFDIVAERLGRRGGELLFFDDVIENVEGARAAGWVAEQFTTVEELRHQLDAHTGRGWALT